MEPVLYAPGLTDQFCGAKMRNLLQATTITEESLCTAVSGPRRLTPLPYFHANAIEAGPKSNQLDQIYFERGLCRHNWLVGGSELLNGPSAYISFPPVDRTEIRACRMLRWDPERGSFLAKEVRVLVQ